MELISAVVIVIILSVALLYIGHQFRLPSIVAFLLIGMLVGPFGFAVITDQSSIELFGQVGIILLLFTIGLEFSFEKLLRSWKVVIIGGLAQVCTTIVAITIITMFLHFPFREALVFGFIVSLSSTAIVMKILQARGEVDTMQGRTLLGILIFQDLAIIPMILITPLLVGSEGPDLEGLPYQIANVAGLLVIIILMAKWVIPSFLYRVVQLRDRELFLITIGGICIFIAWLTSEAGLSVTLGAFVAGLIIGESDYNIDALSHIIPFRDVFAAIFFLSIGMLLDTRTVIASPVYVAEIVLVIIGVKILTGAFSAALLGMPARMCVFTGLSLCQIGEFSFVLAQSGLEGELIPVTAYQLFLAGAIITMAMTPFAMNASPKIVDILYRITRSSIFVGRKGDGDGTPDQGPVNHIIIAGYGITGKSVARAAEITTIPYVVIDLNPEIIRREKSSRRTNFIFGDAVQEEILEHAGIYQARSLVVVVSEEEAVPRIVHHARVLSPSLHIIARTRHIRQTQDLLDLGADEVISEEFESAREIFIRALRKYQFPETEIEKIAAKLQNWGYAQFARTDSGKMDIFPGTDADPMHFHTLRVEPLSLAAGKQIAELDLKNRYGIKDFGLRRGDVILSDIKDTLCLQEEDTLIIFTTDQKVEEISPLFRGGS
ncbi:MAG: cation:proton antiporter [Methanoregula sp.]|jgi:CPA2 family monovalent cation:H+ antiporter-2|nr:cation:proton antiporter [Methanoregula sp.]